MLAVALRLIWSQIRVSSSSESLRKTLAVILRTDARSVPSEGFDSRWSSAVKRICVRSDLPECIYSRQHLTVAVWPWPGVRT